MNPMFTLNSLQSSCFSLLGVWFIGMSPHAPEL
ncbi:hypothetical protein LEMLEM_LOCUS9713 [Lemmus lemmus]